MALLSIKNLSIGYQTKEGIIKAVDDISFELEKGRPLGFVGESGCGKTTIGMTLMGLLPDNARILSGSIGFQNKDLTQLNEAQWRTIRGKEIAMIFQAAMNALNPVMRVDEQVIEAIVTHQPDISPTDLDHRIKELFDLVEIPRTRMRDFPHEYSGGMKQRVIIAMALACNPQLIIADEPTTALDVIVQDQILKEIKVIQRAMDTGMIFISHDIAVVASVCEDICVMYGGQIVETGTKKEVFSSPRHPYTKALLGSYLSLDNQCSVIIPDVREAPDLTLKNGSCRFAVNCKSCAHACRVGIPHWANISKTHRVLCCDHTITGKKMSKLHPKKSALIEMKGVTKEYTPRKQFFSKSQNKVLALNSIDLSIEKGEIFGLVGQSGSGKTTTGRLLVRLEDPSAGHIYLNGSPIDRLKGASLKAYRSKVQMIFQDPYQSLNPHLSISDTILEPLVVHGIGNTASRRDKVLNTLEIVGLTPGNDFYDRYPHQLSGGQRQRVAVARAIVLDPDFIVADEPTSMLDATIAIQLFKLLTDIRKTFDMTFLFITHNLAAANYLCDRIAVIHEGHIVEVNTADKIIQHPEHPYTKKLIQVQPSFKFKG